MIQIKYYFQLIKSMSMFADANRGKARLAIEAGEAGLRGVFWGQTLTFDITPFPPKSETSFPTIKSKV